MVNDCPPEIGFKCCALGRFADELRAWIMLNQPLQKTVFCAIVFGSPILPLGDSHVRNF